MKNHKAHEVGALLRGLAYHDFDRFEGTVHIRDYDHLVILDELAITDDAEIQTERHIQLHYGLRSAETNDGVVKEDWCLKCTEAFWNKWLGSLSRTLWERVADAKRTVDLSEKKKAISLVIHCFRYLETKQRGEMQFVTGAVRAREELGPIEAETKDKLLRDWSQDDDRVTDYYLNFLGQKFEAMVDRAEALNVLSTSVYSSEGVRRYILEASRTYIFGQYIACLAVCRAAIELALEDFLVRQGKGPDLNRLREESNDGLAIRIKLAKSLGHSQLNFTISKIHEVQHWAGKVLHVGPISPEKCQELFFKTRSVLQELYSQ